jgi:multidrug resistance efflux pump
MISRRATLLVLPALACACASRDRGVMSGFVNAPVSAVCFPIPGRLEALSVHEGDAVKRGQVLAQLESRERAAQVAVAEADLSVVEATAKAGVRSRQAALELTRAQLAEATLAAPFDGRVVTRNLEEGEWVAPGTPVLTVERTGQEWVRLDVEETRLAGLQLGQAARIAVVALPGRAFTGRVTELGAEADFAVNRDVKRGHPDVRTFRVRVAFDHAPDEVRPGMTAEVRWGAEQDGPL